MADRQQHPQPSSVWRLQPWFIQIPAANSARLNPWRSLEAFTQTSELATAVPCVETAVVATASLRGVQVRTLQWRRQLGLDQQRMVPPWARPSRLTRGPHLSTSFVVAWLIPHHRSYRPMSGRSGFGAHESRMDGEQEQDIGVL